MSLKNHKMKRHLLPGFLIALSILLCVFTFGFKNKSAKQEEPPVTLAEYNKKISRKDKIVLAYFSAGWCQVCAKIKPILEEVEKENTTKVEVLRIDTDRDKEVAAEFEIDALPVMILYKNGVREWVHVGLIDKKTLQAKILSY
jgi:thioredoxin 1